MEKLKVISNEIIMQFAPCYGPLEVGIPNSEELPIKEWVEKYMLQLKSQTDVLWLLCRTEFMSDKDLRLFAVWCAREALKRVENPDPRSAEACDAAERYANGEATYNSINSARSYALAALNSARWAAVQQGEDINKFESAARSAFFAAHPMARVSALKAAVFAAGNEDTELALALALELGHLLTYFK